MSLGSAGGCFTVFMISVDFGLESAGRISSTLPSPSLGAKSSAELEAAASESGRLSPHPSLVMSQPSPSPLPLQPHLFCGRSPVPLPARQTSWRLRLGRSAQPTSASGGARGGPGRGHGARHAAPPSQHQEQPASSISSRLGDPRRCQCPCGAAVSDA